MKKYKFSYTAASFMLNETVKIASLFLELNDWDKVQRMVITNNILQKKTVASMIRMFKELKLRLELLSKQELEILVNGNYNEQSQINLLAICKAYRFIEEFITEVLRDKILTFETLLLDMDYYKFVAEKEVKIPKLEKLSDTTKMKLKQVMYGILESGGIITTEDSRRINSLIVSKKVIQAVVEDEPNYLKIFLLSDDEILRWAKA